MSKFLKTFALAALLAFESQYQQSGESEGLQKFRHATFSFVLEEPRLGRAAGAPIIAHLLEIPRIPVRANSGRAGRPRLIGNGIFHSGFNKRTQAQ